MKGGAETVKVFFIIPGIFYLVRLKESILLSAFHVKKIIRLTKLLLWLKISYYEKGVIR